MHNTYDVLQASMVEGETELPNLGNQTLRHVRGDHKDELMKFNQTLYQASKYAANPEQENILLDISLNFLTSDLVPCKDG